MRRRVVVTGLGAISPVGNDLPTTWRSLLEGRSGGAPITKFDAERFAVRFAHEVKGFDPGLYMDRKEAKRSDLYTQYAIGEAYRAIQYGDAELMIAGGSEAAVTPMSIGGFANMGALSTRNDAPEK